MPAQKKFKKFLVKKAINDEAGEPPAELFPDFRQWTYTQTEADELFKFYMENLKKTPRTPYHLYRTCKTIRMTLVNCHDDFKTRWKATPIIDLLKEIDSWRPPPDPVHGTALSERARKEARATIEGVFSISSASPSSIKLGDYTSGGASSGPVEDRSFATDIDINTGTQHPGGVMGALKGLKDTAGSLKDAIVPKPPEPAAISSGQIPPAHGYTAPVVEEDFFFGPAAGSPAASIPEASPKALSPGSEVWTAPIDADAPQITPEAKAVAELLKVAKDDNGNCKRSALRTWANSNLGGLDRKEVALALDDSLDTKTAWDSRLCALGAIELLIKDEPVIKRYFEESYEDIQRNTIVVQKALKEKANKVLKALGREGADSPKSKPNSPTVKSAEASPVAAKKAKKEKPKKEEAPAPAAATVPAKKTGIDLDDLFSTPSAPMAPPPYSTPQPAPLPPAQHSLGMGNPISMPQGYGVGMQVGGVQMPVGWGTPPQPPQSVATTVAAAAADAVFSSLVDSVVK